MIGLRICEVCKGGFLSFYGKTAKIEAGKRTDAMTRARQKQENETSRSKFEHAQRSFIKLEVKVNA